MNTSMNTEPRRPLRTSDLAAAGATPTPQEQEEVEGQPESRAPDAESGALEPLFPENMATKYRTRWAEVQSGFVDDPRRAVAQGDELVAAVMQSLAESFAHERKRLEDELSQTGEASTETLRLGLRRYRSFFERLLSL
jgi:hypothetical protein